MKRRNFLKYGVAGAATTGAGTMSLLHWSDRLSAQTIDIELSITSGPMRLIDGSEVFTWFFEEPGSSEGEDRPPVPGPVIELIQGQQVRLRVTNTLPEPHALAIPGAGVDTGSIDPGGSVDLTFLAPDPGTYMYLDPMNAPVYRVLGLHGALVVLPDPAKPENIGNNTPYANPTLNVQRLFNELGTTSLFPGNPWGERPDGAHNKCIHNESNSGGRSWVWLFNQIDPRFNKMAELGNAINPAELKQTFLPRFFTLNGRSGFESVHAKDTEPTGFIGEPALLRLLNAGLAVHSPHIHGNHIYELAFSELDGTVVPAENVFERDAVPLWTLDRDRDTPFFEVGHYSHIKDYLLPYKRPPDASVWPPTDPREFMLLDDEGEPVRNENGEMIFTMRFPMHCHIEMSQTAAGGNYPQGGITDWAIFGPLRIPS